MERPHIVTIGGGKGQSELLRGLRDMDVDVTAIVTVMDSGGSTGVLRNEKGIVGVGDVRRCIAAFVGPELEQQWNGRDANGHAFGNIVLAERMKDGSRLTDVAKELLSEYDVRHRVLPVTEESVQLCARLNNGEELVGEGVIDEPTTDISDTLREMYLEPVPHCTPEVTAAIREADCIVLTMGDLFTSVVPNLLVTGVVEAMQQRRVGVPVVAICNRTTKRGETDGYTAFDYYEVCSRYLAPAVLDVLVYDNSSLPVPEGAERVADAQLPSTVRVVRGDFADQSNPLIISGARVAPLFLSLCTSS